MTGRPADWAVLDLSGDPTPGAPLDIRDLAGRLLRLAADAADASVRFRRAGADEAVASWTGLSGDAYRAEIGAFPSDLDKLSASYGMAGRALTAYAGRLDGAQTQADVALARGRDARARLVSAQNGLSVATSVEVTTSRALTGVRSAMPDPATVTAAVRNHAAAATRLAQSRGAVEAVEGELDAARRLALAARSLREEAEDAAAWEIHAASHAGIRNKKWWQKLPGELARGWHILVKVAKIVVLVLGVIALIIGGPAAWILFAAALIVLTDTLIKYSEGKASIWAVALTALACIPGTKGLTSLGEISSAIREGEGLLGVGRLIAVGGRTQLADMVSAVRGVGRGLTTIVRGLPGALADSIRIVETAGADGSRLIAGIVGDPTPLRNLLMSAISDGGSAGGLPAGWKSSVTASEFNLMKGGVGILSTLDRDGILELAVDAGPASELRGHVLFDAAMAHFGDAVKVVQGAWFYGDNLGKVNELVASGVDLERAITGTWTATQAARHGFSISTVVESELESPGLYDHVIAHFTRPGG